MHKIKNKCDKSIPPFRPINSSIKSYNYELAKFLSNMLTPLISKTYCAEDSFSFVKELQEISFSDKFIVSYDVVSLYTNIPLIETIEIAVNLICEKTANLSISKEELTELFHTATSMTHFQFDGKLFDQIDGVSMGSPLAPALANLFMSHHEKSWLESDEGKNVLYYKRYVDDIFCIVENENESLEFLGYLNRQHPNLKFTIENESEGKLPFLDIMISRKDGKFLTTLFRKATDTGLLTNFLSFTFFKYKTCLIKTLVDRLTKINSTKEGSENDLKQTKLILQKNGFPESIIESTVAQYFKKNTQSDNEEKNCRYYKLPYIGRLSTYTTQKINKLVTEFCKANVFVKIAYTPYKIMSSFSTKDKRLESLKSYVVYKFCCAGCNSCYVGHTTHYLTKRIDQHFRTDVKSHVFKHLQTFPSCKAACNEGCFEVIDNANSKYTLKVKEALWIKWENPDLNKQKKYGVTISLCV